MPNIHLRKSCLFLFVHPLTQPEATATFINFLRFTVGYLTEITGDDKKKKTGKLCILVRITIYININLITGEPQIVLYFS